MAENEYPARCQFFAMKFIRIMVKTCVAQDLGSDVFALLSVIASTEDAKRYRGPVTFFNEQLMPLAGIGKWEKLARIRDKAVAAGWLRYNEPARGTRKPGTYWVLIPESVGSQVTDCPVDEDGGELISPESGSTGISTGISNGGSTGISTGGTILPTPKPLPEEKIATPSPEPKPKRKPREQPKLEDMEFPPPIDTPEVRSALSQWLEFKTHKRQFYESPLSLRAQLKMWTSPSELVDAINFSIAQNYTGIHPRKGFTNAPKRPGEINGVHYAHDIERAPARPAATDQDRVL